MALSEYASLPRYCVLPKDCVLPQGNEYLILTLGRRCRPRSALSTFSDDSDFGQFQDYVRSSDRYEMRAESPHALYGPPPPRGGYPEERARTPSEHEFVQRSDISSDSMEPPTGLDAQRNFERQQVKCSKRLLELSEKLFRKLGVPWNSFRGDRGILLRCSCIPER